MELTLRRSGRAGFMEEEDGLMFDVYKQKGRGREFRL